MGRRHSSDPVLLWLWRRPVATAPIQPLAWDPPYAAGATQENAKRPKKKKKKKKGSGTCTEEPIQRMTQQQQGTYSRGSVPFRAHAASQNIKEPLSTHAYSRCQGPLLAHSVGLLKGHGFWGRISDLTFSSATHELCDAPGFASLYLWSGDRASCGGLASKRHISENYFCFSFSLSQGNEQDVSLKPRH